MTKTALITGAAKRAGKAMSIHLSIQGWNIAIHYNTSEKEANLFRNELGNIAMKCPGGLKPILKSLDYILENNYLTGQLLFCDGGENLGLTN